MTDNKRSMQHNFHDTNLRQRQYWPTWIGLGLLRACALLPYPAMMAAGRFLGRRLMQLSARRSRIAAINLDLCFPELSPQQHRELVKKHFESVGMGIMEMALSWWVPDKRFKPLVKIRGEENLHKAFEAGKGVILLSAHFTTLEIMGRLIGQLAPVLAMYRPNENPVINKIITENRNRNMDGTIPREDVRLMLKTLKANKAVWFAPDQNFGHKHSVFADFFGIAAATNTATSRFAKMTRAKVVPMVVLRLPDNQGYELHFESALPDFPSKDVQQDTQRVNHIIERWAKMAPEQYLWIHRRFKDRPEGETPFY